MGRAPCCSKVGLKRGPWSTKEDTILTNYIQLHGEGQWRSLPINAGLLRCGKSCRLRWMNYLRPGIKRGNIDQDEEDLIARLHGLLGNRWSLIAGRLPGRTDNEIKNHWNTHLLKKLTNAGIITPKPHRDLPKPPKTKNDAVKKKSKPKKVNDNKDNSKLNSNDENRMIMKVYMPKAIRVSSGFSRTGSCDSLTSGSTASCDGGEKVAWSPEFDGLGGEFVLPVLHHHSGSICSDDVSMLEQVYDEYLQLLD